MHGCVNDGKDIYSALTLTGFAKSTIHTLFNARATKANILRELKWLCEGARSGDLRMFFYSGHGTQLPDQNSDEPDQIDECICPVDIDFNSGESTDYNLIRDDDLKAGFDLAAPGSIIDAVFDSCYAGTVTRQLSDAPKRSPGRFSPLDLIEVIQPVQRFMPPPLHAQLTLNNMLNSRTQVNRLGLSVLASGNETAMKAEVEGEVMSDQRNALWSACLSNQVSEELDDGSGTVRGAFTAVFAHAIRASNGDIDRLTLYRSVKARMAQLGYEQRPSLETPTEEALLHAPFRKRSRDDPSEWTKSSTASGTTT